MSNELKTTSIELPSLFFQQICQCNQNCTISTKQLDPNTVVTAYETVFKDGKQVRTGRSFKFLSGDCEQFYLCKEYKTNVQDPDWGYNQWAHWNNITKEWMINDNFAFYKDKLKPLTSSNEYNHSNYWYHKDANGKWQQGTKNVKDGGLPSLLMGDRDPHVLQDPKKQELIDWCANNVVYVTTIKQLVEVPNLLEQKKIKSR